MSRYVVGDIHACFDTLCLLLEKIGFNRSVDTVWLAGDLVNRGPKGAETVKWARSLEGCVRMVLGNHDVGMIAQAGGVRGLRQGDSVNALLADRHADDLFKWLRAQPLLLDESDFILVHAGLHPCLTFAESKKLATIAQSHLKSKRWTRLLENALKGASDRIQPRVIMQDTQLQMKHGSALALQTLTRMRYLRSDTSVSLGYSGHPDEAPQGLIPWFRWEDDSFVDGKMHRKPVYFGHWAGLGLFQERGVHCLDSGCGWGGDLTCIDVDTHEMYRQARVEPVTDRK